MARSDKQNPLSGDSLEQLLASADKLQLDDGQTETDPPFDKTKTKPNAKTKDIEPASAELEALLSAASQLKLGDAPAESQSQSKRKQSSDEEKQRVEKLLQSNLTLTEVEVIKKEPHRNKPKSKGKVVCPSCGFEQIYYEKCEKCGIVFEKYLPKIQPSKPKSMAKLDVQVPAKNETFLAKIKRLLNELSGGDVASEITKANQEGLFRKRKETADSEKFFLKYEALEEAEEHAQPSREKQSADKSSKESKKAVRAKKRLKSKSEDKTDTADVSEDMADSASSNSSKQLSEDGMDDQFVMEIIDEQEEVKGGGSSSGSGVLNRISKLWSKDKSQSKARRKHKKSVTQSSETKENEPSNPQQEAALMDKPLQMTMVDQASKKKKGNQDKQDNAKQKLDLKEEAFQALLVSYVESEQGFMQKLAVFTVKNIYTYTKNFAKFEEDGLEYFTLTWHWSAFFFPFFWCVYRKLYRLSFWALISSILFPIISNIVWGLTAYYLYFNYAKGKIEELEKKNANAGVAQLVLDLRNTGGTSVSSFVLSVILVAFLGFIFYALGGFEFFNLA